MIRAREHKKKQGMIFGSLVGVLITLYPENYLLAQEMPTGASVKSGNITITGTGTSHMVIDQKTHTSIINWKGFSIHSGGRVDFNMPSSSSSSLNLEIVFFKSF